MYFSPEAAERMLQAAYHSGPSERVTVRWREVTGGTVDPVTGRKVGGVAVDRVGTMQVFGREEPARSVVRTLAEIQTGDLFLDLPPQAAVALADGAEVPLASVLPWNPRVMWGGREYVAKDQGGEMRATWDARAGGISLGETLWLRPAT